MLTEEQQSDREQVMRVLRAPVVEGAQVDVRERVANLGPKPVVARRASLLQSKLRMVREPQQRPGDDTPDLS